MTLLTVEGLSLSIHGTCSETNVDYWVPPMHSVLPFTTDQLCQDEQRQGR